MSRQLVVSGTDVERITSRLFLSIGDVGRNLTAFWTLIVLSAIIASSGVVADSTATVIGAMIVAPLMTPILGTALALVLADSAQLVRNIGLVLGASLAVVVIGYGVGMLVQLDVVAATNSQVAGRVSPGLIDLLAALATGLVGAFALIRSDVSDTLPGVAIAISLVPPLAVVGLTLESGAEKEALGALLLFGTNVAAILATGTLLMLVAGVRDAAPGVGVAVEPIRGRALLAVGGSLVLLALPLGAGSYNVVQEQLLIVEAKPAAEEWAASEDWAVDDVSYRGGTLYVEAIGGAPEPDPRGLRRALDDAGLADYPVEVKLLVGGSSRLGSD